LSEIGINTSDYKDEQGFIFNDEFVDRKSGSIIAVDLGYILNTPPSLYSEDLW
jgi:hypothetical protein